MVKKNCKFYNVDRIIGWWERVSVSEILTISIFKVKWQPTAYSWDSWNVGNTTYFYTASSPTNKSTLEIKCYIISKSSVIYVISEFLHLNQINTSNRTAADITLKTLSSVHFRIGTTDTNNGTLFLGVGSDWVHLVCQPLFGLLYQPRMIDVCGAVGGIRIGRGKQSTRRKPAPVLLCPPQIPHDLN